MDPGVSADGTAFFTVPGTVIEAFETQMEIVSKGRVTFADLSVVHPKAVAGCESTPGAQPSSEMKARLVDTLPDDAQSGLRVLPFETPPEGELPLPLDTGSDSLFIMAAPPPPLGAPADVVAAVDEREFVDVHRHPDVDEYIIRSSGSGFLLNGPQPETIVLTPFRGPCVIVMPAGAFHRIVQVEDGDASPSILIYADRRAVVDRYEVIMANTSVATLVDAAAAARS